MLKSETLQLYQLIRESLWTAEVIGLYREQSDRDFGELLHWPFISYRLIYESDAAIVVSLSEKNLLKTLYMSKIKLYRKLHYI